MITKPKLSAITPHFLEDYLTACGVEDVEKYLNPDTTCFDNPMDYINMDKAVNMLKKHIDNNSKVCIVVDADVDGCCSTAIQYLFLTKHNITPTVIFHTGKQHGLNDIIDQVIASECNLCWIADAGSNDITDCQTLKANGIDVIITDHHNIISPNPYAIVVNNQAQSTNKHLSGAGVTYKLVQACDNLAEYEYMDIVAVSIISDVCNLTAIENRGFIHYGFNNVTNPFLQILFEKQCKRRGVTPEGISWDIAPLGNALARMDEQDKKSLFFDGLVGKIDCDTAVSAIRKVKRTQDDLVKMAVEELEDNIDNNHKAIIGFTDSDNKNFLGLIANKFTGRYNKPSIILRELNSTTWSGSLRSPIPLLEDINNSKLATCQGHDEACGITIKKSNLTKFAKWLDKLDISVTPDVDVTANITTDNIGLKLCQMCESNNILWGTGVPKPCFHITLNRPEVFIYEKKSTTIKICKDGISFLLFFAKSEDVEQLKEANSGKVDLVVELVTNEYNGEVSCQGVVKQYEVIKNNTTINWEDIF